MKSAIFVLALTPAFLFADTRSESLERISDATTVLHEIMSAPDKGIPDRILPHGQRQLERALNRHHRRGQRWITDRRRGDRRGAGGPEQKRRA